jgi:hypothetical protein
MGIHLYLFHPGRKKGRPRARSGALSLVQVSLWYYYYYYYTAGKLAALCT